MMATLREARRDADLEAARQQDEHKKLILIGLVTLIAALSISSNLGPALTGSLSAAGRAALGVVGIGAGILLWARPELGCTPEPHAKRGDSHPDVENRTRMTPEEYLKRLEELLVAGRGEELLRLSATVGPGVRPLMSPEERETASAMAHTATTAIEMAGVDTEVEQDKRLRPAPAP